MPLLRIWLLMVVTGPPLALSGGLAAPASAQLAGVRPLDPPAPLAQLHIDLWGEKDGLPQNMASAFAQTPDGFLWLGTEEGLVRFDGVRFQVHGPETSDAFSTAWVTTLLAESDGTLWIGTGGGGLVRMRDGAFTAFTMDDGLTHNHVRSLLRDRDGALWVGTNGGGAVRLLEGRIDTLDARRGLSDDFVLAMARDSAGSVWLGTGDGLNRVDDAGITVFRVDDGLPDDRVRAVLAGRDGSIWAGTVDGGLGRFRDGRFTTFSTDDGLSSRYVTSLYEDPAGALWIGTNGGGINRLHDGRIESIAGGSGLPGDLVLSLGGDREGNVWLGLTGTGIARLRDGVFTSIGRPEGLSADIALAVLEDSRGDMWIGTPGGGLNHLRDGRLSAITTEQGLAHDVVIGLAETRAGDIWVGMAAGGISRIRDGRVTTFGLEDGLVSTQVIDFAEDADGYLWLATLGAGIQRWRPGDRSAEPFAYSRADGLPDDFVTTLLLAADGTLWAGTRGGLATIADGEIATMSIGDDGEPSNVITDLYEDADGTIWVATNSGLARVRDGDVVLYGTTLRPFDHEIHGIVEDSLGHLWLSANRGIARVRKADLEAVARGDLERVPLDLFNTADGMRSAEANGGINPAAVARRDGTLWFPTMRGVAVVDPRRVTTGRPVPAPILEHVAAADSLYPLSGPVSLPPGSRSLEFHFTAPTFTAPDEVAFRYALEGFDTGWVEAGGRRVAYYTNVPPGRYRFRVATRRGEGEWSDAEAAVDLVLAPRFFERAWFLALSAWCLIALAVVLYRLRIRALTRRQQELMDLMDERARTERALRVSEERLRLALDAGRMGTWEWDIATGRISTSQTATAFFGFEPGTLDEVLTGLAPGMEPEDHQRLAALPGLILAGRKHVSLHFPVVSPDGVRRHIELRGRASLNAAGGPVRVAGVVADVTEVMNAQEELRQREEELRQAQKMEAVGRLAGGVAHDFNNLLTAIGGRTHLVLEALAEDDELRHDIEEIRDAAERAANLTQQLLTFSRKQVHQPAILDLNAVIGGVERMLRRLIRDDVVLETRLAPDVGRVHADPGGLEQILLNLAVNAQDAMPDGGNIRIETRSGHLPRGTSELDDGTALWTILSVSDTGQGMSAETQKQVFEPFFTTKPVGQGTGLGLATVYGIVQQNGGHIRVASQIGSGTRFQIYFPAVAGAESGPAGPDASGAGRKGSETILLVEDEPAVRSLVRKILERRGYTVLDAADGIRALEICRDDDRHIHMLVSDVVMPHIGGRELAEQVLLARPQIRVLLMSGYNEDEVLRRGVPGSGMEFIQKPFEPDVFARRVRAILDAEVQA